MTQTFCWNSIFSRYFIYVGFKNSMIIEKNWRSTRSTRKIFFDYRNKSFNFFSIVKSFCNFVLWKKISIYFVDKISKRFNVTFFFTNVCTHWKWIDTNEMKTSIAKKVNCECTSRRKLFAFSLLSLLSPFTNARHAAFFSKCFPNARLEFVIFAMKVLSALRVTGDLDSKTFFCLSQQFVRFAKFFHKTVVTTAFTSPTRLIHMLKYFRLLSKLF